MVNTYHQISYIIHYTVPSYHRCIHTYGVRIRDKGITLKYYILYYKDMHPGNLVPVSYILSALAYTYTLYTILYSYHN